MSEQPSEAESVRAIAHRRRRVVAAGALVALSMVGCGGGDDVQTRTAGVSPDDDLSALGSCPEQGSLDFAPAPEYISKTAEWVQVDPVRSSEAVESADRASTSDVALSVRTATKGASEGTSSERKLRMHGSFLEGLDWANGNPDAEVYLGIGGKDHDGQVLFAMVVGKDGEVAFAGECQRSALTDPLLARFDEDPAKIRDLVGLVGPGLEAAVLEAPPDPVKVSVLNPEDTEAEVLAKLTLVTVRLDVPAEWSGPATICTRVAEGWNDCVPLDGSVKFPTTLSAYVNDTGVIEVWLLDEAATLTQPVQKLGETTIGSKLVRDGALVPLVLTGTLTSDGRSVTDADVAGPDDAG